MRLKPMKPFNAGLLAVVIIAIVILITTGMLIKQTITYQVEVTYLDASVDTLTMARTGRDLRDTAPWLSRHGCLEYYNDAQACGVRTFRVINKSITKQ
jgi:hypothetical protein